jgi:hypothetical protein
MNEIQEQQFEKDFDQFIQRPEWLAYTSQQALALLCERTRQRIEGNGGYSSISAFEISFRQLVESGEIKKLRPVLNIQDEDQPFTLTLAEYRSIPTSTIIRKYQTQPTFKAAVDSLIAQGLI